MAEPESGETEAKGGGARPLRVWTRQILGSIGGLVLATGVLGAESAPISSSATGPTRSAPTRSTGTPPAR